MTTWSSEELNEIGNAEEIEIATLRRDGTLRRPVTIWVVRLGNDLYIRSVKGRAGGWYPGARSQYAGRIQAGSLIKDAVLVEDNDLDLVERLDGAYRAKYGHYPSAVAHINSAEARAATIRLLPR